MCAVVPLDLPGYVPRDGGGAFAALESPRRPSVYSLQSLDRSPSGSSSASGPPAWLKTAGTENDGGIDADPAALEDDALAHRRVFKSFASGQSGKGTYKHKRSIDRLERKMSRSLHRGPNSGGVSPVTTMGLRHELSHAGSYESAKLSVGRSRPIGPTSSHPYLGSSSLAAAPVMRRGDSRATESSGSSFHASDLSDLSRETDVEGPSGVANTRLSQIARAPSPTDSKSDDFYGIKKVATAMNKLWEPLGRRLSYLSMSVRYSSGADSVGSLAEPPFFVALADRFDACFAPVRNTLRSPSRQILRSRGYHVLMVVSLFLALFLKDIWIASDIESDTPLDAILTSCLILFLGEWFMEYVAWPSYNTRNLFFWMDLLGAASLVLDITYFGLELRAGSTDSAVILRAARVLKLSARAGRFVRVVRLLHFLPGFSMATQQSDLLSTKGISSRLITALAARTSLLIIFIAVVLVPVFNFSGYPGEEDRSMEAWIEALDETLRINTTLFTAHLQRFENFYEDLPHFPYELHFQSSDAVDWSLVGITTWNSARGGPSRKANKFRVEKGAILCDFNLTSPNQTEAWVSIGLMVTIIVALLAFSGFLSGAVSLTVVSPLEQLLSHVRKICETIFSSASELASAIAEQQEGQETMETETIATQNSEEPATNDAVFLKEHTLLRKVQEKLGIINEILISRSAVDAALEHLDQAEQQMLNAFQGRRDDRGMLRRKSHSFNDLKDEELFEQRLELDRRRLEEAVLDFELLNSWNFNPLELDQERNHAACEYFMGIHNHGLQLDNEILRRFLVAVEENHLPSCPYHNWFHAVDVMHCVYRFLHICSSHMFLNSQQRYAVLVCALGHDLRHPGLSNSFLIETSHELALRYNDKSPLENMHSALLWELSRREGMNIFAPIEPQQLRDVRQACVEMILYTDSSNHFPLIKEVQLFRGVNSEIFDEAWASHLKDQTDFPSQAVTSCLRHAEARLLFMKSVLHFADLSHATKPFRICRVWSWQLLEEGFLQGDFERELGIPVQALNDRELVNRAFSQINYIEFLLSPLLLVMVKFLPPIEDAAMQALRNMRTWYRVWVSDTKPFPSEAEKKALQDRLTRLEIRFRLGNLPHAE